MFQGGSRRQGTRVMPNVNHILTSKLIVIILIGILVIILGMIIGIVTHKIITIKDRSTAPADSSLIGEALPDLTELEPRISPDRELYELQLLLSVDPSIAEFNRDLLQDAGYRAQVKRVEKADKIIYILQLRGKYPRQEALRLGNEIKLLLPELGGYWLERAEPDSTDLIVRETIEDTAATVEQESTAVTEKPLPVSETLYELQILADMDINKVNRIRDLLEDQGYKTKITQTVKNGNTYYRLRLQEVFTLNTGQRMGEELKQKFIAVEDYWLEKIRVK
ncbi:MAG: hypothetical protein JXB60_08085 [Candidatus Cloacimonetes bacterium]|nr:hypothetical protein [Candidatus Cloacimonadota bacterium]